MCKRKLIKEKDTWQSQLHSTTIGVGGLETLSRLWILSVTLARTCIAVLKIHWLEGSVTYMIFIYLYAAAKNCTVLLQKVSFFFS